MKELEALPKKVIDVLDREYLHSEDMDIMQRFAIVYVMYETETTSVQSNLKALRDRLGAVAYLKIEVEASKVFTTFREEKLNAK